MCDLRYLVYGYRLVLPGALCLVILKYKWLFFLWLVGLFVLGGGRYSFKVAA